MKARFTDEQIISMIKEQQAGEKTADVCRRHALPGRRLRRNLPRGGSARQRFTNTNRNTGGMEPSDAKRLRALEAENGKLKKLLAERMLTSRDIAAQYPAGQGTTPCCEISIQKSGDACSLPGSRYEVSMRGGKRKAVAQLMEQHQVSQRRACDVLQVDRSTMRYLSRRGDDAELRDAIKRVSRERRRFGCRRVHVMIAREGFEVNHKKVRRIYTEEKLQVRRRGSNHGLDGSAHWARGNRWYCPPVLSQIFHLVEERPSLDAPMLRDRQTA